MIVCLLHAEFSLPPFMIYPRKRITKALKVGAYPDTSFNYSDNGWITQELYIEWFEFFPKTIPPTQPVLLVEDGHLSHVSNRGHQICL